MLRDRLVVGVQDSAIQKRLLSEQDINFEKAFTIAKAMEMASKDVQDLRKGNPSAGPAAPNDPDKVNKLAPRHYSKNNDFRKPQSKNGNGKGNAKSNKCCWRCGGKSHDPSACPFKGDQCYKCSKTGHTKSQCEKIKEFYKNKSKNQKPAANYLDGDNDFMFDGALMHMQPPSVNLINQKPYELELLVDNKLTTFEVDTGSPWSIISQATHTALGLPPFKPKTIRLNTYNGSPVDILGSCDVSIKLAENGSSKCVTLLIAKQGASLVGRDWLQSLDIDIQHAVTLAQAKCQASVYALTGQVSKALEDMLLSEQEVFDTSVPGKLAGFQAKVYPIDNAEPKFYKAFSLPYATRTEVDKNLDDLLENGIIEPVPFAEYACPLVVVKKPDNQIRICGNYKLTANKVLKLEQYPIPTFEDLVQSLQGGQHFTKLDLSHAYHQLELEPQARKYTTINTHRGLFQYRRLPFGIASAPAIFQRTMESVVGDIPMVKAYLDDLIVSGRTEQEHLANLLEVLSRLRKHGMKLKREKCEFFKSSITYLGHQITADGIRPVMDKLKAIREAPEPQNVEQLQAYLGLLGYYRKFIPNLSKRIAPLNELLKADQKFNWGPVEIATFKMSKGLISSNALLVHYDPTKPLLLQTDASPYGLGAVISHEMPDGTEKPIAFASRSLTPSEKNYAQYEKEALSVVFGVKKFHQYLLGRQFTIVTDHMPLVTSLGEKPLSPMASSRMARWQMLLSSYQYNIVHKSGKHHNNADALSRLPLPYEDSSEEDIAKINLISALDSSPVTAEELKAKFNKDSTLVKVRHFLQTGWPDKHDIEEALQPFFTRKEELSVEDGLVLWGNRVIIPNDTQLKTKLLEELHATHPGIVKMKGLARSYLWWPKIDAELESTVRTCTTCQEHQRNPETVPIHPWEFPANPWERIHLDFAQINGQEVLIAIDAYSKWIEATPMNTITATATIRAVREMLARFGLPKTIVTDNGTQFVSEEFYNFLTSNGITFVQSPPKHPSSNGLAERAVQTVKHGVKKIQSGTLQERLQKFLLYYRVVAQSTTGLSPSELLLKRRLRTRLDLLRPSLVAKVKKSQTGMTSYKGGKERQYKVGDSVLAKNFAAGPVWLKGQVVEVVSPTIVEIQLTDNRVVRRHLDSVRSRVSEESGISTRELLTVPEPPLALPGEVPREPVTQETPAPMPPIPDPNQSCPVIKRNPARLSKMPPKYNDYVLNQ
jgi:transposase InsO family protein